jgi:phage gp36-like protein
MTTATPSPSIYATVQQVQERYPERDLRNITDPDGQVVDTTRIAQALDDASAEIEGYLERRYVLPLANALNEPVTSANLVRCACDIAVYRLQTLRPTDDVKDARQRYEDAIKFLKSLAAGESAVPGARLRADVASATPAQSAGLPQFGAPPSLFGRVSR